jgi:hypothetical protein
MKSRMIGCGALIYVVSAMVACTPGRVAPPFPLPTPTATRTVAPTVAPTVTPTVTPAATATPVPTPGAVVLAGQNVSFTAAGSAYAQSVTATQANYIGSFAASTPPAGQTGSCSGIASISQTNAAKFSVTPVAAGHCVFSIAGGGGESAPLTIDVTTTTVGGS